MTSLDGHNGGDGRLSFPGGKRYRSYAEEIKARFGHRLQKLVLDAGFTCPNRDGTVGKGGCTFCDNSAFHPGYSTPEKSITRQLDEGIGFHKGRYSRAGGYLAYFQAFSNTYASLGTLKERYLEALSHPEVCGLVIGTRPDCVDEEKLEFIASLRERCKLVCVEYGIESCFDSTLDRVHRGHDFACAEKALEMTAAYGLETGAHFILGLPGETAEMLLSQCEMINSLPLGSVKFHQLQIVRGTEMEREFGEKPSDFLRFGLEEYIDFSIDILERLRPGLAVERIAGEIPPRFVSPLVRKDRDGDADGDGLPWGKVRNFEILRMLDARLEERGGWQGRLLQVNRPEQL